MTKTKSQKARAAAKKGSSVSNATSSAKVSSSAPKVRKAKSKKSGKGLPAVLPDNVPKIGIKGLDTITVEVSQWLTTVQTGIQTGPKILQSFYLNPQSFLTAGRLSKLAALYEKYYFEHFEATYHPNVAVTNQGSVFMALDMDPEDALTGQSGIQLMNSVAAMGGKRFQMGAVYEPLRVEAGGKADFSQILYVDPDRDGDRMAYAGRLIIGAVSAFASDLQAGFVTIKARIKFLVPALDSAAAAGGYMSAWNISSPTGTIPWGTAATPSTRNNIDVELRQQLPDGTARSCLFFQQAGVFLVEWFSTGTALTTGTVAYGGGASAITGGDAWCNPKHLTPSAQTEDIGYLLVAVPATGGWVSYTNSGTHSNSSTNFIRVFLTPYQLPNANPTMVMLGQLQERLSSLSLEMFRLKSDSAYASIRSKPSSSSSSSSAPLVPGDTFETETSSSSSSTMETFNCQPTVVTTSGSSVSATEQVSFASSPYATGIRGSDIQPSEKKATIDSPVLAVRDLGNVYNRLKQSYRDDPGDTPKT
jgi:hypothetical protein